MDYPGVAAPPSDGRAPLRTHTETTRVVSELASRPSTREDSARLALAEDTSLPLLERAKFLAIVASNLDEFKLKIQGVQFTSDVSREEMESSIELPGSFSPTEESAFEVERFEGPKR